MKQYIFLLCVTSALSMTSWAQTPLKPVASTTSKPVIGPGMTPANSTATSTKTIVSRRILTPAQNQAILKHAFVANLGAQTLTGVIPGEGTRGTAITISGQDFGNNTADIVVKVNNVAAIVTGMSDNQILAIIPDKAGTGPITVAVKGKINSGVGFIYDWNAGQSFVAGVAANAPGFADGTGAAVKFNHPTGLARDAQGNIYIADCENNRIRKMNTFGQVTTIAGSGAVGFADGMGTAASFHHPYCVAVDAAGNVYVGDLDNHLIRKITPGGMVTTLAGSPNNHYADGIGRAAGFGSPRGGICVDGTGNVYVGDGGVIRKITPAGVVSTLARGFNNIVAMIYNNGELYVCDGITIDKVSLTGGVYLIAGAKGSYRDVDGYAEAAQFGAVVGMAMDAAGVIYITEENADDYPPIHLRRVAKDGFVQTIGFSGLGMGMLAGSVGDAPNTFYQADMTWNCIRKVTIQ